MLEYTLIQQHATSDKYGKCRICGKFVSDVYSQQRKRIEIQNGKKCIYYEGEAFGHKKCLIGIRK